MVTFTIKKYICLHSSVRVRLFVTKLEYLGGSVSLFQIGEKGGTNFPPHFSQKEEESQICSV